MGSARAAHEHHPRPPRARVPFQITHSDEEEEDEDDEADDDDDDGGGVVAVLQSD